MEYSGKDIKETVQQIAEVLLSNGGFLINPGLYSGEVGLVLFFSRYARFTQNDLYLEYAYGLIEKIQHRIHLDTPINYKYGLTGIGSAFEYLVQNGFFEADTDEILEDFDKRIFFTYNIPYLPVQDIVDIWYYIHWRLSGDSMLKDEIQQFILPQTEKAMQHHFVDPATLHFNQKVIPADFEEKTYARYLEACFTHPKEGYLKNDFWKKEPGLQNGLAGWGMSLLTELDGDDSWFALFQNDYLSTDSTNLHEI